MLQGMLNGMEESIKILIADDNIEFGDLLSKYLSCHDDMEVVGVAREGVQTIDMIKLLNPDMVILDIIMPNLDGIGVLEQMASADSSPMFIILSGIGQDTFIKKAMSLGAQYYIVKPFDVEILVLRIRQIYTGKGLSSFSSIEIKDSHNVSAPVVKQSRSDRMETEMSLLMRETGIPPHIKGYRYIKEAVMLLVKRKNIINPMTRLVYPKVAEKFNTTPQRVERSIRNAIKCGWTNNNERFLNCIHGKKSGCYTNKPSNSEFLNLLVDRIKL
jgi:two-component system, response regulator, stage 0 sporulation protein A